MMQVLRRVSEVFPLLYPDESDSSSRRRQQYLLDMYLNMPDKGPYETPLHIAAKHGKTSCVRLLTAYHQCDKERFNKFGLMPKDVSCLGLLNMRQKFIIV